jgi:signal transduction histidine kinase
MKSKIDNSTNQLRRVVLLLAIAVILPTVCLLWFMTQAVKNERLAIRQKMIDTYTKRSQEIFHKYPLGYRNLADKNLTAFLQNLPADNEVLIENLIKKQSYFSSLVIYDAQEKIIYPAPSPSKNAVFPESLQKEWKLEYVDKNYEEAIKRYDALSHLSSNTDSAYDCKMAVVRCLSKQNKNTEAIEKCRQLAYSAPAAPSQVAYARLMLADLYSKTNHKDLPKELQNQLSSVSEPALPAETKIFTLGELIKLAEKSGLADQLNTEIQNAKKIIDLAGTSIAAADYFADKMILQSQPEQIFFKIQTLQPLYAIHFKITDKLIVGLITDEKMTQFWQKNADDFTDELVFCKIYDNKGQLIAGQPTEHREQQTAQGEMFSTLNLKNYFAGWKVELYFRFGGFKGAANKRMLAYLWIALIVIAFMLASTLLASRAVLKQARFNRLKNDFIATVTHELKTPLSSMRVLVDTLLEGRCESRQQETEYLQLISKENVRLSKLIDNFLTFSRMERNKQVFDIAPTSPVEIANNAAQAIQAKFEKANVHFGLNILKPLPMVEADKDAMITILVNLLDNAYKYSYDNKQIELNVFAENNSVVCFSVKDNGIGMTRRQMRKIFDRFYQADTSLARRTEGAGLGLSIVKFIVDAHKGQINVESRPDKGSIFTVKLPIT